MSTRTYYTYVCDECGKEVKDSSIHRKCFRCSINLCRECYNKRDSNACKWCDATTPTKNKKVKGAIIFLLFIIPLALLFLPIPKSPIMIYFSDDPSYFLEKLIVSLGLIIGVTVYGVFLYLFWKKSKNR